MRVTWHFSRQDITLVLDTIAAFREHPIIRYRTAHNLADEKPEVSPSRFWRALTMALLTTRQPSGPRSPVSRFLSTRPFPLAYDRLVGEASPGELSSRELVEFGGIRRHNVIGEQIEQNLRLLEFGEWPTLLEALRCLTMPSQATLEREVADYLAEKFLGLGPKQARNLLLDLGLSRYEVPIDSRVARWLRNADFPVPINAVALSDRDYYCFVLDGLQALCRAADVYPCLLDGAVFASFDQEGWSDELMARLGEA